MVEHPAMCATTVVANLKIVECTDAFLRIARHRRENRSRREKSVIAINHPTRQALNTVVRDFLTLVPGQSLVAIRSQTPSARRITVRRVMIDDRRNYRLSPPRRSLLSSLLAFLLVVPACSRSFRHLGTISLPIIIRLNVTELPFPQYGSIQIIYRKNLKQLDAQRNIHLKTGVYN